MRKRSFKKMSNKNYVGLEAGVFELPKTYQVPENVKNMNGKPIEKPAELVDNFDEFEEKPVKQPEQKQTEAPQKADQPQAPTPENPKKSKAGRKSRKKDQEALETELKMVGKKHVLHEKEVLEITYKSIDKNLLRDLLVKQLLTAYQINEDTAPSILNFLWEEASVLNGNKTYISSLQEVAKSLQLSYPSVQKVVKKLDEKEILVKTKHGYWFSELLEQFFESLTVNQQIVLTFEEKDEEQLEAITKDSKINEEMAN